VSDDWLPTNEAMAYLGVKQAQSMPMWTNRPPASRRSVSPGRVTYKPIRVQKRGNRKFYFKPDLDAYLAFQSARAKSQAALALHKPVRVCAACGKRWPCQEYRQAER
jgi:hypothetical protein